MVKEPTHFAIRSNQTLFFWIGIQSNLWGRKICFSYVTNVVALYIILITIRLLNCTLIQSMNHNLLIKKKKKKKIESRPSSFSWALDQTNCKQNV